MVYPPSDDSIVLDDHRTTNARRSGRSVLDGNGAIGEAPPFTVTAMKLYRKEICGGKGENRKPSRRFRVRGREKDGQLNEATATNAILTMVNPNLMTYQ